MLIDKQALFFSIGIAVIVAQIPSVDQFRWPGYFTIIYSFLLGLATMVLFREKRGDVQKKGGPVLPKNLPIPLYVSSPFCTFIVTFDMLTKIANYLV